MVFARKACWVAVLVLGVTMSGCGNGGSGATLFQLVDPNDSGVLFANTLQETVAMNITTFPHLYNGGGVAVGDINGDDLPDLFFTGTQVSDRLYVNKGDLQFEDATAGAGILPTDQGTSRGVTMADVNSDGHLDIYVCRGGTNEQEHVPNQLFVNNGDGTFSERAEEFGLADAGFSIQATFFDYDLDGDLDAFVLNAPIRFEDPSRLAGGALHVALDRYTSDRLYRNDGGRFVDVTEEAGVASYAFGLSTTVADFNEDGWPDMYVANDFVVPDFLYINNGDGTFSEPTPEAFPHTTFFSMGSDAADMNNDGHVDLMVLDMNAEDSRRQKLLATGMSYDGHRLRMEQGYRHQVMRNALHVNNGDGTFSETGQLAGISNTDWSWGPVLADFDNDGLRDVFIANGYRRDVTNLDYMQFTVDSLRRAGGEVDRIEDFLDLVPTEKLQNYAYRNRGDLTFENVSEAWGLDDATFSNGTAYADLDLDGDLDLVINDLDGTARLYRNLSDTHYANRNWLVIAFDGPELNPFGMGARVRVLGVGPDTSVSITAENFTTRGFYSAVEPVLHFGLGEEMTSASVEVTWPDGQVQRLEDVGMNERLVLHYADASDAAGEEVPSGALLFHSVEGLIGFAHTEDTFVDFRRDLLIPHMHSREGPPLAAADVNGDGLDDLFVGGAAGQAGQLFLQQGDGSFQTAADAPFSADASSEDTRALFFDANGDGVLDLYVASGGSHLTSQDESAAQAYQDRLYMGDGQGGFQPAEGSLPLMPVPTGAVAAGDVDGDGDADLFVGGRVVPGRWPESPRSYLLINEGGRFTDQTEALAPGLAEVGLVTGAVFADVDGDGSEELVIAGEWMAPQVWSANGSGGLELVSENGLAAYMGWWNTLSAVDVDGDGDVDLLGGNLGLNSRIRGSLEQPVRIYAKDFDNNGSLDPILTLVYPDGGEYPIHRREMMMKQLPYLQQRFPRYGRYAASTIDEVFRASELEGALTREAGWFSSTWFENDGAGQFIAHALPMEAQVAPIYAFVMRDVNGDGHVDLIAAGNNRFADVERGPYDAGRGLVLLGNGQGGWESVPTRRHGLALSGDVRSLVWLRNSSNGWLVAGNNDAPVQVRAIGSGS